MTNVNAKQLWVSTAIGLTVAAPGMAQTSPAVASASAGAGTSQVSSTTEAGQIPDIIVTARRRVESLQRTPVTVTAFTGAELEAKGVNDFNRLAQITPGLNFDAFPRAAPRPFFRGIGSTNQGAGSDPSSVAFLDGVYLARSAMLGIDFFDMERVEVLKGPQGTLFGKNVVGGAVNFITAKPKDEASAQAQLTLGEFDQHDGHIVINLPVTKNIATRLVLGAVTNGGFRHTPNGLPLDDQDKLSARLQTLFNLGTGTSLLLSGDYARQNLAQDSRYNVAVLPFRTTKPRGFDDYNTPRVANPDRPGGVNTHTGGAKAELNTDVLGFATLTATAAWRTLDYFSSDDFDGTDAATNKLNRVQVPALQVLQREHADSYSGETRLTSRGTGPLSGVIGIYYNHDDIFRERESQLAVVPTSRRLSEPRWCSFAKVKTGDRAHRRRCRTPPRARDGRLPPSRDRLFASNCGTDRRAPAGLSGGLDQRLRPFRIVAAWTRRTQGPYVFVTVRPSRPNRVCRRRAGRRRGC